MKTLIIYDGNGNVIQQIEGHYKIPVSVPYLEVEVPEGKIIVSVNTETKEPIYEDIPKSDIEILRDEISILEAENATLREGLQAVLSGDMQSLAYILYPEDFTDVNNTTLEL